MKQLIVAAGLAMLGLTACASEPKSDALAGAAAQSAETAPAAVEPFDPFNLEIEAGRWGAMNAQMAEIVGAPPAETRPPLDESDLGRRETLSDHLRLQVSNLTQVKARACPVGKLGKPACDAQFNPDWALRKENPPADWAELQKRSDSVGDAVMPVWDEICAAEKDRVGPQQEEEMICPME